jgi:hypothetical protein
MNYVNSITQYAGWIPGILLNVGVLCYGAFKMSKHERPAIRVILAGCLSLFASIGGIASFWFLIRDSSSRRFGLYQAASFGFEAIHIAATILLLSAVFMDRMPRGPHSEARQSFPQQMQ